MPKDTAKSPIVFFGDHKFPPYEYLDDGKPAGANVELIKAVGEALGRPVEIRLMAWPEAQKLIGQGEGLAKSLAELHGGNLVIASEVGRGTTVIVQLPKGQA